MLSKKRSIQMRKADSEFNDDRFELFGKINKNIEVWGVRKINSKIWHFGVLSTFD